MTEEWSEWIDHDGKGCPCVGQYVQVEYEDGEIDGPGVAGSEWTKPGGSWDWRNRLCRIIRYRIRRPRALLQLIELVENLPAPERVQA